MAEPRECAERLERAAELPAGDDERFTGYGVISLPFSSGDVLALRRFPACSLGPAATTVWHRSPDGAWEFFSDEAPLQCCPRYFAHDGTRATVTPIQLSWTSDRELSVTIDEGRSLDWTVRFASTLTTRLLNATGALLPDALWRQPWVLAMMGRLAGTLLNASRLRLHGQTVSGQTFQINPRLVWTVADSQAGLDGRQLGHPAALSRQTRLGDFWIPQRGLFAVGRAFFEPFEAGRHTAPALDCGPADHILAAVR